MQGAKKLNDFLIASPDIYYFSLATSITKLKFNSNYHVPQKSASILTRSRSRLIGSRPGYWGDGSSTDSTWYENDGVVNTVSMYGPTTGENGVDPTIKYDKNDILINEKTKGLDRKNFLKRFGIISKYLKDHPDLRVKEESDSLFRISKF